MSVPEKVPRAATTQPTPRRSLSSRIGLTLAGLALGAGAWILLFIALFPHIYAESGSASYARAHRGEALLQTIAAAVLLWLAWQCLRRAVPLRIGMAIVLGLLVVNTLRSLSEYRSPPARAEPIGGRWYVVPHTLSDDGTRYYDLYMKRMGGYAIIGDFIGEYRLVPPDCIVFRGLSVASRTVGAMCGDRMPVETSETLTSEAELLERAKTRPKFRRDWRTYR